MQHTTKTAAILVLADGTIFHGKSIGIQGKTFGEVCFNTGMTGYQEIFTDPSYFGQIMVATNPHIGNYHDLSKVRRIGEDFLIACHSGVEANFAKGFS